MSVLNNKVKTHQVRLLKTRLSKLILLMLVGLINATCIKTENEINIEKKYQGLIEHNIEWIDIVNRKGSLTKFYHSSASLLFGNEWYLTIDAIEDKLHELNIKNRTALCIHEHDSTKLFEIGEYVLSNDKVLVYIAGYSYQNGFWLRRIEILYEKTKNFVDDQVIERIVFSRDKKWKKLLLIKDAEKLIDELFWREARYFNLTKEYHTNTYEELIHEYRWIELPNIQFSVKTLDYRIVNNNVIYIIGQYQARMKGLYTLILTKNDENVWKNILDANY